MARIPTMARKSSSQDRSEATVSAEEERQDTDMQQAQEIVTAKRSADELPDGGYGWICVMCCALINAHTWGINSVSEFPSLSLFILVSGTIKQCSKASG